MLLKDATAGNDWVVKWLQCVVAAPGKEIGSSLRNETFPTKGEGIKCKQCDQEFLNVEALKRHNRRQNRKEEQCMETISLSKNELMAFARKRFNWKRGRGSNVVKNCDMSGL